MSSVENLVKLITESVKENLHGEFTDFNQRLDRIYSEIRSVRVEIRELVRRIESIEQDMTFTKQAVVELRTELNDLEKIKG